MNHSEGNNLQVNTCCPHCIAALAASKAREAELLAAIELKDQILACYRTGKRPSGKLLDALAALSLLPKPEAGEPAPSAPKAEGKPYSCPTCFFTHDSTSPHYELHKPEGERL